MPTYCFEVKDTEEEFEVFMDMDQLDEFLADHPHLRQIFWKKLNLCYRVGRIPVSEGWRERLRTIAKNHPGNTIEIP